jgi:hypothetical protein
LFWLIITCSDPCSDLFWHYFFLFGVAYKLVSTIIGSYYDSCSRLLWHFICFVLTIIEYITLIKNINLKVCQNIVKWDFVSKFSLSEIQWCGRNLILILSLLFIVFLKKFKQLACKGDINTVVRHIYIFVSAIHI